MRPALITALREYYQDTDDATDTPRLLGIFGTPQSMDPHRLPRLLLRALREVEQDRRALETAVQALEQRVAALEGA